MLLSEYIQLNEKAHEDQNQKLDVILKDGKDNLIQSTITNGRLKAVELITAEHKLSIESFKQTRWYVRAFFTLIGIAIASAPFTIPIFLDWYVSRQVSAQVSTFQREEIQKAVAEAINQEFNVDVQP